MTACRDVSRVQRSSDHTKTYRKPTNATLRTFRHEILYLSHLVPALIGGDRDHHFVPVSSVESSCDRSGASLDAWEICSPLCTCTRHSYVGPGQYKSTWPVVLINRLTSLVVPVLRRGLGRNRESWRRGVIVLDLFIVECGVDTSRRGSQRNCGSRVWVVASRELRFLWKSTQEKEGRPKAVRYWWKVPGIIWAVVVSICVPFFQAAVVLVRNRSLTTTRGSSVPGE